MRLVKDLASVTLVSLLVAGPAYPAVAATPAAEGSAFNHDPVSCLVEGEYPQLDATAAPDARVRVVFSSGAAPGVLYTVDMTPDPSMPGHFIGVLPRPTMAANPITYYVEVLSAPASRTADIVTQVISRDGTCSGHKAPIAAAGPATATPLLGGAAV